MGELHRQASGEDGGLGGRDIVGDSAPPNVLPVTAVDEVAGTFFRMKSGSDSVRVIIKTNTTREKLVPILLKLGFVE